MKGFGKERVRKRKGSGKEGFGKGRVRETLVSRLPQVLPAKISAAEFALILSMVASTIVATAFWIAMIYAAVKPNPSGVTVLLVSDSAKGNASLFPSLFVA